MQSHNLWGLEVKNQSIDKSSKYKKRAEINALQLSKPYINLTTVESINRHNNSRVFIPIRKYLHSLSTRAFKSKISCHKHTSCFRSTNYRSVFRSMQNQFSKTLNTVRVIWFTIAPVSRKSIMEPSTYS